MLDISMESRTRLRNIESKAIINKCKWFRNNSINVSSPSMHLFTLGHHKRYFLQEYLLWFWRNSQHIEVTENTTGFLMLSHRLYLMHLHFDWRFLWLKRSMISCFKQIYNSIHSLAIMFLSRILFNLAAGNRR